MKQEKQKTKIRIMYHSIALLCFHRFFYFGSKNKAMKLMKAKQSKAKQSKAKQSNQ
jgi:hypothetical protein